jgi:hypothetical protein
MSNNHSLAGVVNKETEKITKWTIHRHRQHWKPNTQVKDKHNTEN